MPHTLMEIERENWIQLLDLYRNRCTEPSGYGLLQTIIKWIEKDSTLNIKIYSLDGNWKEDGTFVLFQNCQALPYISFNTLCDSLDQVTTALNCLDIKLAYLLFGFPERLVAAVEDHFKFADMDFEQFKLDKTVWYHIEREKALRFEIEPPKDFSFSSLEEQHAEQINSIWPHRSPGSIDFVKLLIRLNDSAGLFDKAGNLIAWCLRLPLGSLGLLQVIDSHKRQGLGNLVVRYLAKNIALKNEEVMAPVVEANKPSRAMFEKLGFSGINKALWALKPLK